MSSFFDIRNMSEFRAAAREGGKPGFAVTRANFSPPVAVNDAGKIVIFDFSTEGVDRHNDRIFVKAWMLDDYRRNPVVIWGHDASQPESIIGKAYPAVIGKSLRGPVNFPPRGLNPLADMVYDMIKADLLNATSVGFRPLEWQLTKDKSRPGGIDFTKVELLEISIAPIPANPDALVVARGMGIDTAPMIGWAEKILDANGRSPIPRDALERARKLAGASTVHRAGRVLSSANQATLRQAHDAAETCRSLVASVIDQVADETDPDDVMEAQQLEEEKQARARRVRKAKALRLSLSNVQPEPSAARPSTQSEIDRRLRKAKALALKYGVNLHG